MQKITQAEAIAIFMEKLEGFDPSTTSGHIAFPYSFVKLYVQSGWKKAYDAYPEAWHVNFYDPRKSIGHKLKAWRLEDPVPPKLITYLEKAGTVYLEQRNTMMSLKEELIEAGVKVTGPAHISFMTPSLIIGRDYVEDYPTKCIRYSMGGRVKIDWSGKAPHSADLEQLNEILHSYNEDDSVRAMAYYDNIHVRIKRMYPEDVVTIARLLKMDEIDHSIKKIYWDEDHVD